MVYFKLGTPRGTQESARQCYFSVIEILLEYFKLVSVFIFTIILVKVVLIFY